MLGSSGLDRPEPKAAAAGKGEEGERRLQGREVRAGPGMCARPALLGHGSAADRPLRRAGGRAPESAGPGGGSGRRRRRRCGARFSEGAGRCQ